MRRPPPPLATVGGHQPDHHLHHRHPLVTARHQLHLPAGLLHLPASLLHRVDRAGPLESPWVAGVLGALLVASVVTALWRRRRRLAGPPPQHRWLLAHMLQARGQQAGFTEVPGAIHTWRGARAEAPYALAFASSHLAGARPRVPLAADRARPPRVSLAGEQARLQHPAAGSLADRPRRPRATA